MRTQLVDGLFADLLQVVRFLRVFGVRVKVRVNIFTQPKMPQTYCKLSNLPACCNLSTWVATSLSILSSCNKSVKIRLVAICDLQNCYNLLKQLAASLLITSLDNQPATSLLTTCNRLFVTSCRKPCERIQILACCKKLLQNVNRRIATCVFLAL